MPTAGLDQGRTVPFRSPATLGYRMPAEWAPHARTWMAWPSNPTTFPGGWLDQARAAYARVARAIAGFEPVTMLAPPDLVAGARDHLGTGDGIEVRPVPLNDSWLRDTGPTFLVGPEGLAGVDWGFNGWGHFNDRYDDDARAARAVLRAAGARRFAAPMILEGGSIHGDGDGTLITTRECLLAPNRNPHLSADEIESILAGWLGVKRVIWLDQGLANDDTDGHVDNICAFAAPGVVLIGADDRPDDDSGQRLAAARRVLEGATDAAGRALAVHPVPLPLGRDAYPAGAAAQGRMPMSYLNFYICNGAVIVPAFGDPNDQPAAEAIAAAFPNRQVVPVDTRAVVVGGGNIHCITQQEPLL